MQAKSRPSHEHLFDAHNPLAERRTRQVMWLTASMMVVEIFAGTVLGSMALLADGWHMSSHALALGVAAAAYALSRRLAGDLRFAFGTWKIEVLGGYTSAVFLLGVAAYMGIESASRLMAPTAIRFDQAIPIAAIGLLVNIVSAWLLSSGGHHHDHGHGRAQDPRAHHHDLNLRSAYVHVLADAATSVFAIAALLGGKYLGATWLDPVMGLAGTVLVGWWAVNLLRVSARVLLDAEMDAPIVAQVRDSLCSLRDAPAVHDLHIWRVGKGSYACIVSLSNPGRLTPQEIHKSLAVHKELVHVTVELDLA